MPYKRKEQQLVTLTCTEKSIPQLITAVINHTSASCQIDRIPQATLKTITLCTSLIPMAAPYMAAVEVYAIPLTTRVSQ